MDEGYLFIKDSIYNSLLAVSAEEQSLGLMYHNPPTPIMSFIYSQPSVNKFWMHNTPAPLDIIFCLNDKVSQICYGQPYSTSMIGKDELSNLIIEMPYGTCKCSGIEIGNSVGLVKPTIQEIFDGRFSRKNYTTDQYLGKF